MTDCTTKDLFAVAFKLHTLGFSVIPSGGGPKEKDPLVKWKTFQTRRPTDDELQQWRKRLHPNLWGIVTGQGSGVVVVDADSRETRTMIEADGLQPHVVTPRGGAHFYFSHPGEHVKTVTGILPKVDIRGDGGFANVIGHRADGEYQIVVMPSPDSLYPWDRLPAAIKAAMASNGHKGATCRQFKNGGTIPIGENDTFLVSRAGSYRSKGDTELQIFEKLKVDVQRLEQDPAHPYTERDLRRIARSVSRYEPSENAQESTLPPSKVSNTWTCENLLKAEFPPPVWIVPDLLPVGLAILAGRPKLGKSRLALQLAVAVGTGGMWLDHKVEQGPVLAVLMEDSPRRIKERLLQMNSPCDAAIRFQFGLPSPLNTGKGLAGLWALVDEVKPRLVIMDTLARCFGGKIDWNAVGDTVSALSTLQAQAMKRDICILFVDHHRKGTGENRDTISDVVSSVAKPGIADTIMGFYRSPGKKEWTLAVTGRDVEENELALEYHQSTGCWQCLGDAESVRKDSVQSEVVAAISDMGGTSTTAEIAEHTGLDRGLVSRTLGDLLTDGFLTRGKKEGKNVPYSLV